MAALGQPIEKRNFRYDDLLYPSGQFRDHWRPGQSVPDVSRPETKLWLYFLGASFIDVGCEAIHFGQAELMNRNDRSLDHYWHVLTLIRSYAAENARRGMVLCDSHVPSAGQVLDELAGLSIVAFDKRNTQDPLPPDLAVATVLRQPTLAKRNQDTAIQRHLDDGAQTSRPCRWSISIAARPRFVYAGSGVRMCLDRGDHEEETEMNRSLWLSVMMVCGSIPVWASTPVMVQDFEAASEKPSVWVVNIPNDNASVGLSTDQPQDGRQCLKLQYQFVGTGDFQYLGIPNKVRIQAPIHKLRYWIKGDNSKCSYGLQVSDASGETHQYRSLSTGTGQGGIIDFTGWKEVTFDLVAPHETWGGDRNGKLDLPMTTIVLTIGQPVAESDGKQALLPVESELCFDALSVDSEKSAEETLGCQVSVLSPEYCSDVKGDTPVTLSAPGFKRLKVRCWKQGDGFGSDSIVATVALDAKGNGSFAFPADDYPHGPVTVTISGDNGSVKDNCYLQLYNRGGVSWNEGMPGDPPPAEGMSLVFADDFSGPLSISSTNLKATYYDHKPPNGWQDFSTIPFTSYDKPNSPFNQVDSYLRIRASEKAKSSGLMSSMKNDASGITAGAPCYFECRFIGPNAIGTWPAFWLLTDYMTDHLKGKKVPCDELDIIEAYGGEGHGSPNAYDTYMVVPHAWDQGERGKVLEKKAFEGLQNPIRMRKFGIPSTWYERPHTYGCKITETDTIYYCDNIEVGRHPTLPLSKTQPFFFLINLATGGGWPVDLSRYNGMADMYVDYVRVYQGKK